MSNYQQKPRRNLLITAHTEEQVYHESPDQEEQPEPKEFLEIEQLCKSELAQLEQRSPPQSRSKTPKKKGKKQKSKHRSQEELEDLSDSQYQPDSIQNSFEEFEDSGEMPFKMEEETRKKLSILMKKHERELGQKGDKKAREIAWDLHLPLNIVKKHIQNYLRTSALIPETRRQHHHQVYKKTELFDQIIRKVIKNKPYACINDLRKEINQHLGLDLAKQTLIRRLKNLGYNYIKFGIEKPERKDEKTISLRKGYFNALSEVSSKANRLMYYGMVHIALDECRGSMWMKSKPNGQVDHTLYQKEVVNVVLILSKERVEYHKTYNGYYNYNNHLDALSGWIRQDEQRRRNTSKIARVVSTCLVLEHNHVHNPKGALSDPLREELLKTSGIQLLPFPPFSSSFNPSEVLFNQIKYAARSRVKSMSTAALKDSIEKVMKEGIDKQDIGFVFSKVEEAAQEL